MAKMLWVDNSNTKPRNWKAKPTTTAKPIRHWSAIDEEAERDADAQKRGFRTLVRSTSRVRV